MLERCTPFMNMSKLYGKYLNPTDLKAVCKKFALDEDKLLEDVLEENKHAIVIKEESDVVGFCLKDGATINNIESKDEESMDALISFILSKYPNSLISFEVLDKNLEKQLKPLMARGFKAKSLNGKWFCSLSSL